MMNFPPLWFTGLYEVLQEIGSPFSGNWLLEHCRPGHSGGCFLSDYSNFIQPVSQKISPEEPNITAVNFTEAGRASFEPDYFKQPEKGPFSVLRSALSRSRLHRTGFCLI
jgi:hypothetical protein